uniref:Uncharacterized protein n=1 Tax=Parascaris equorum TaxID=6256 RepID=A0A914REB3_PAREQ
MILRHNRSDSRLRVNDPPAARESEAFVEPEENFSAEGCGLPTLAVRSQPLVLLRVLKLFFLRAWFQ